MENSLDIQAVHALKEWLRGDEFAVTIHIASSHRSHDAMLELLRKFVLAKLRRYVQGSLWRKKYDHVDLIQMVWVQEGTDIYNSQVRGFFKGSSYIKKNLRMKSTEVQRHYHVLVRLPKHIKNTKLNGVEMWKEHLVVQQLRRIINEYYKKYNEKLDWEIENNHYYDKSQQSYVTKGISVSNSSDSWGFV